MIPSEAMEAAIKALDDMRTNPETLMDYLSSEAVARVALEAAAPIIQAQALEDAAADLDDKRLLSKAFHIFYPEWLRGRAAKLRTAK